MKQITTLLMLFCFTQVHAVEENQSPVTRTTLRGEAVLSLYWPAGLSVEQAIAAAQLPEGYLASKKPLLTNRKKGEILVEVKFMPSRNLDFTLQSLAELPSIRWASPNYQYEGDPREHTPNDEQFSQQYHHKLMRNDDAWDTSSGNSDVIVAVLDDGVDYKHEDLKNRMWRNPGEIPDNNIDDDDNGYVDDVVGWDTSAGDNDISPSGSASHGTHVAGIIAAESDNQVGVAGTSPNVRVMGIRFYGSGSWTSKKILESYKYATDNGAKIITVSYRIDQFVGDKVYESALDYAYDEGLLLFNSAGNGYAKEPKRIAFTQLILVCNTDSEDEKASSSNYGVGVDICAPGTKVLAPVPGNKYAKKTGTSMASPNAAAVAALIWSTFPHWDRDQVAAALLGSTDDIDAKNSKYKGMLGVGRVQSHRALTGKLRPATLHSVSVDGDEISLRVDGVLDPKLANDPRSWSLVERGKSVPVKLSAPYRVGTNIIKIQSSKSVTSKAVFKPNLNVLRDPFGQAPKFTK